jgi:hypothetical protein
LFQQTILRPHNNVIGGDEKLKRLKIVLALAVVIGLVAVTISLSFALYTSTPFDSTTRSIQETFDEDWWTEMIEYMEVRWNGIEDEKWFNEMTQYMEEPWNEIQSQEWFNQMLEYMENRGYYHSGFRNYDDTYYNPRSSGRRGFGCWGW